MATITIKLKKKPKRKPGHRAGMTRTKIVLAAAAQIEKAGLDAFSMRGLAKSLGVAPTTISAHFKGGLLDLKDEIVGALVADVAPPFQPKQEPVPYIESVFFATLKALQGRPTLARLTILRLISDPLVAPALAERVLASLTALGVAPSYIAIAYRGTLQGLIGMILAGPARAPDASTGMTAKPSLSASEFAYIAKFREAVLADLAEAGSWTPDPEAVKAAVQMLMVQLGVC
jgi:TetR/AcrR family tetracycline transcriptional repressor